MTDDEIASDAENPPIDIIPALGEEPAEHVKRSYAIPSCENEQVKKVTAAHRPYEPTSNMTIELWSD